MRSLGLLALLICLLALAQPAAAITYGQADGSRHPNVGALVGTFDGQSYPYCTGTLIAPTVFLTAAHCDLGTSRVTVMFDSAYSDHAKLYSGTYHADPRYTQAQDDPHDIAVVVFDRAITKLAPARLPTLNQFAGLDQSQRFTAVGYGAQEVANQPGGPINAYFDTREYAVSSFNALGPAYMRLSQNPATGDGGTCYGDSGGPNFLGAGADETDIIAGTTITGDMFCKSTNVIYRLDTESARSFLGQFVTLP